MTDRRWLWTDVEERVARLNRKLRGWSNYFRLGTVSPAYGALNRHSCHRLRRWLCAKHKVKGGMKRYPDRHLHEVLGLVRLSGKGRNFLWANA